MKHRKKMLLTSWLVLAPSHFPSFVCFFPFFFPFVSCVFTSKFYCLFLFSPLCLSTSCSYYHSSLYLSYPPHPLAIHPSLPFLPSGQAALTCICLAWMSPKFGLNAPIILLNYDVLLWALLLHLCSSLMKAGTAQQNHLQRPD